MPPQEQHDHDAEITDDEAYTRRGDILIRESWPRSMARSSGSIEIDDDEEEEEDEEGGQGSKTL